MDRARCYGYESARNAENGTKTTILLLEAIMGKHTKQTTSTTKNNTPKQKKDFKRAY